MTELLAITGRADDDPDLIRELVDLRADRVTVLIDDPRSGPDWGVSDHPRARAVRDRLARLLDRVEHVTGAVVVGVVGTPTLLAGRRFAGVVTARNTPVAA